jgi:hypothetical protein
MTRKSATLTTTSPKGYLRTTPIWVYEVNTEDIFPVKFEYKQRGYKGLRFSEQLSKVSFN